jgi:hypothetical protein
MPWNKARRELPREEPRCEISCFSFIFASDIRAQCEAEQGSQKPPDYHGQFRQAACGTVVVARNALRKRKLFSLKEVSQAIAELLVRLNERPFRKRPGSRATRFAQLDRPALKPLPATRFQFGEWETARVNIDYHIEVGRHFYSVPYALVHQEVDVHLTAETVEVLHRGVRVASHIRSDVPAKATSLPEHMPKAHQRYLGRTRSTLIEDGQQVGPSTGQLVEAILAAKVPPGAGLSFLAWGFYAWRRLTRPSGWKPLPAGAGLQLPEHGLDPQEPTRPAAGPGWRPRRSASPVCLGARQHPRRRLLRFPAGDRPSGTSVSPKENYAQSTNHREAVHGIRGNSGKLSRDIPAMRVRERPQGMLAQ